MSFDVKSVLLFHDFFVCGTVFTCLMIIFQQ